MRTKSIKLSELSRSTTHDHAVMIIDTDPTCDFYAVTKSGLICASRGVRAAVPVLTLEEEGVYGKFKKQSLLSDATDWVELQSEDGRFGYYYEGKGVPGDFLKQNPDLCKAAQFFRGTILPEYISINEKDNTIKFKIQNGPTKEVGINGCQLDDIFKAGLHILKCFQELIPCEENAVAIENITATLKALSDRRLGPSAETSVYHEKLTEKEVLKELVDNTDAMARSVFENLQQISKENDHYDLAIVHMAGVIRQLDGLK